MIAISQAVNITMTLLLIYAGLHELGMAITIAVLSSINSFLQEYVFWGYAYCYWITSQNVDIIYSNMVLLYDVRSTL